MFESDYTGRLRANMLHASNQSSLASSELEPATWRVEVGLPTKLKICL